MKSFVCALVCLLALACVAEAGPRRTVRGRDVVVVDHGHDYVSRAFVFVPSLPVVQAAPSYVLPAEQVQVLPKVENVVAAPAPAAAVSYAPVASPSFAVLSVPGYYHGTVGVSRVLFFRDRAGRVFRVR